MSSLSSALALTLRKAESYLNSPRLTPYKNFVFVMVMLHYWSRIYSKIIVRGPTRVVREVYAYCFKIFFKHLRRIPSIKAKIDIELNKTLTDMEDSLIGREGSHKRYLTLPRQGLTEDEVRQELEKYKAMGDIDWEGGRVSGAIYHGGDELSALLASAYALFSISNPLHADVFPGVRKMEAECVSMVLHMYNAPATGCGTMTSGGTESILMACKAYREMGHDLRGVTQPEMIIPETAHAAFYKAAEYFRIKLNIIPVDPVTMQVSVKAVSRAINRNTVMIVGSAVQFPHGIADDIVALSLLAKRYHIGMHVDCCLGSFILPFLEKAGFPTVPFDFRVDGVTSISCDTHKYGFAPKGSSVIMYRHKDIRKYQYFVCPDWSGGIYASPSIAGSRPGALIAGCWAALVNIGENGYLETAKQIVGARQKIQAGIESIPELYVNGKPLSTVLSFSSRHPINIYDVGDHLRKHGWNISPLQNPPALHISITLLWVASAEEFVRDLVKVVAALKADPSLRQGKSAAIYGTAASLPDKSLIAEIATGYIDLLYKA